ncbi:interferon-inducible GTPase 5-like isoform X1 [Takifugu flavidus]|uniref:interferon-inducible GTPase 5-like isoform X1 n=1 Tax=Takifugu flavidus TaxID=433684 RepID=UPI002544AF96|nr:interferon-inducible GTPase 5-like isoform X1 [Takifugu flavidus]
MISRLSDFYIVTVGFASCVQVIMADFLDTTEIREALQNNNQALAVDKIKKLLERAANTPLNIGITGESGSGKSSFVNAFRGVDHRDDQAAPTGVVETTTEVRAYPHPSYPNVTLWDLPGIGTTRFPADQYLKHVRFERFDFFIIISDTRFRENDVKLAQEIQKMGKKFYFVLSKVDNDLQNAQRSQRNFDAEQTLALIRENCEEGLLNEGVQAPQVFLLSNFELRAHDFHRLHATLERELPEHKRDALLVSLANMSLGDHEKKKEAFKSKIPHYAFVSAACAAVTLPGLSAAAVDADLIAGVVQQYKTGFGLDQPSLQRLVAITGVPLVDLTIISSPLTLDNINTDLVLNLMSQSSAISSLTETRESYSFIPLFGILVARKLSYEITERALHNFLDMLTEDAQDVYNRVINHINS